MKSLSLILGAFVMFFVGFGAAWLIVWVALRLGAARRWPASLVARLSKEATWLIMFGCGVGAAAVAYTFESVSAGHFVSGPIALAIILSYVVAVALFGVLGGLLLRKAGMAGFGQVIGAVMGAVVLARMFVQTIMQAFGLPWRPF